MQPNRTSFGSRVIAQMVDGRLNVVEPFAKFQLVCSQLDLHFALFPTETLKVRNCAVKSRDVSVAIFVVTDLAVSAGIHEPERVAACIEDAVEIDYPFWIGHHRIRRDEGAKSRIVVAGVVVQQPRGVAFLPGEGAVGLEVSRRGVLRTVGVVGAAGCRGCPARGQRCAAQMVAVQVVEVAAALDRNM